MLKKFNNSHIGVLIGRFQPFHKGHMHIINDAIDHGITLFKIFIGSANSGRTIKNPFTYEERREMISEEIKQVFDYNNQFLSFEYYPLNDYLYNDLKWALEFNTKLDSKDSRNKKHILLGFNKDSSSAYLNWFPELEHLFLETSYKANDGYVDSELSATSLRNLMFLGEFSRFHNDKVFEDTPWKEHVSPIRHLVGDGVMNELKRFYKEKKHIYEYLKNEFEYIHRYKQSWKTSPYEPTFITTDALIIQDNNILLVKRKQSPFANMYALPGGFLQKDKTLKESMLNEIREESNLRVPLKVLEGSIVSQHLYDMIDRDPRGRFCTNAFFIHLKGSSNLPRCSGDNVETSKAFWMPISNIKDNESKFAFDHLHIIYDMLKM